MIKINLLPKELREKDKGLDWVIVGYALIGFLALAAASLYLLQLNHYKKDVVKKEKWSQQLSTLKAKVAQVEQLDAQKTTLQAKKNTVVQLFQGRLLYPQFMEKFFEILPQEVWITDLTISEDAQRNLKVVAVSNALTPDAIASWLETLESKPDKFTEIQLSAIEVKQSQDLKQSLSSYGFSMSFTFHPPSPT